MPSSYFERKAGLGLVTIVWGVWGTESGISGKVPFLEQIIEPTRHADRAAVWPQTARRPHTLFQRHRAGIPPWPGDQVAEEDLSPVRRITRRLHDGAAIIAFHEIRGRQPMQPGRLLLGTATRMALGVRRPPAALASLSPTHEIHLGNREPRRADRFSEDQVDYREARQARIDSNACASRSWGRIHVRRPRPPASRAVRANRAGIL